jgi:hypothetical protein
VPDDHPLAVFGIERERGVLLATADEVMESEGANFSESISERFPARQDPDPWTISFQVSLYVERPHMRLL